MRAIAATLVVVCHLATFLPRSGRGRIPGPAVAAIAPLGRIGVAVFFVISGFLLYRPFVARQNHGLAAPPAGRFWVRRGFRILPGYWVTLAVLIVFAIPGMLEPFGQPPRAYFTPLDYFTAFALVQNYRRGTVLFFGLGVAWTLVIEVAFYFMLPFFDRVARGVSRLWSVGARSAQWILVALLGVIGVGTQVFYGTVARYTPARSEWFPLNQLNAYLPYFLTWFGAGMALAIIESSRTRLARPAAIARRIAEAPVALWALAGCAWVVCAWLLSARTALPSALWFFAYESACLVVATLLVLPAVLAPSRPRSVHRLLTTRIVVLVGTVSYGVYLWHMSTARVYASAADGHPALKGPIALFTIPFAGAVGVAYLLYILVERPSREIAQRLLATGRSRSSIRIAPRLGIDLRSNRSDLDTWCARTDA
jgi:peptidoglycan/LPS O-acetylase OafA/YrhL